MYLISSKMYFSLSLVLTGLAVLQIFAFLVMSMRLLSSAKTVLSHILNTWHAKTFAIGDSVYLLAIFFCCKDGVLY